VVPACGGDYNCLLGAAQLLGGKAHRAGTFNEISSTFQHQCGVFVGGPRVFWLNNQRYYILGPETWLLSV
jgi:hypothetical protein